MNTVSEDMTNGNIIKHIMAFSLPLIVANIFARVTSLILVCCFF